MTRANEILRLHHVRHPPQRVDAGLCFYCGNPMQKWRQQDGRRMPDDAVTVDHVFPEHGRKDYPADMAWLQANKVECCQSCNMDKARLHPLDWLVIMPDNEGAQRLATLLGEQLWVPLVDIQSALWRRK